MCRLSNTTKQTAAVSKDEKPWTDKEQHYITKRGKILPNGLVLQLSKKSDWHGFKRLISNLSFLLVTGYAIHQLDIFQDILTNVCSTFLSSKMLIFVPLYILYGFQMQCMAFGGGHEMLHGNAFKTRWINTLITFIVSTAFFEVLWHERLNHKQHHVHTLCIDNDPELTSFYSRKELEALKFKSAPQSRYSYVKGFLNVYSYFEQRICRLFSSCVGIATDYTGIGWSIKSPQRKDLDPTIIRELQRWSLFQLGVYLMIIFALGNTLGGIQRLLFWWIAPCVIGYGPINYFRNAEHADCDLRHVTPNQLHNTRTVESNRIIRWLLWETNFHAEHHAYPTVPFYNLPVLHDLLDDHIKHNDCKSFTAQNWQMIKAGGWIDKQNS